MTNEAEATVALQVSNILTDALYQYRDAQLVNKTLTHIVIKQLVFNILQSYGGMGRFNSRPFAFGRGNPYGECLNEDSDNVT